MWGTKYGNAKDENSPKKAEPGDGLAVFWTHGARQAPGELLPLVSTGELLSLLALMFTLTKSLPSPSFASLRDSVPSVL